MRQIAKGREPSSLGRHRASRHASYDNFPDKDELRTALVREQRGLCCYCMGSIRAEPDAMKIEHWRCQAAHPDQALSYANLLGACPGGEHAPAHLRTCDSRKGSRALKWNPADPVHQIEARVQYDPDGSIRSDDVDFDTQLREVLNLNLSILKQRRKAVYDGALAWWKGEQQRLRRSVPRDVIERKLASLTRGHDTLPPYRPVAVSLLKRKLAQAA